MNETRPKFFLYGEIFIVSIFSMFINGLIMGYTCTNCPLVTIFLFIFVLLPILLIGFIVFLVLRRTKVANILNEKNVHIFCIVIAGIIIAPAALNYYYTVPPKEVTHIWAIDNNQPLQTQILGMSIFYDNTYGKKGGYLFFNGRPGNGMFVAGYEVTDDSAFTWSYDASTQELTLQQGNIWTTVQNGWELTLKLIINTTNTTHSTMTTQYVKDANFNFFNATLFNGVTWFSKDLT